VRWLCPFSHKRECDRLGGRCDPASPECPMAPFVGSDGDDSPPSARFRASEWPQGESRPRLPIARSRKPHAS
jgi:hypothetical protein